MNSIRGLLLIVLLAAGPAIAQDGGVHTQTFSLKPGWNAIFVEVIPEPFKMDAVFSDIPVEGVWGWFPPSGQINFIDDHVQEVLNFDGWRGWFPRPSPNWVLSNLFGIEVNRAYLIKLSGELPRTLEITGRPVNIDLEWTPNSFNLVGFQIDPSNPPTFGTFLAPSDAHAAQPVYRLTAEGSWQPLASQFSTQIQPGEAYWVYTHGNSTYQGPLEVDTEAYDGMEYSAALDEILLTIRNRGHSDAQIRLRPLSSSTAIPFLERRSNEDGAEIFTDLTAETSYPTIPGQDLFLRLGVRRADLTADRSEQILEITDGLGSRRLVFAGVARVQPKGVYAYAGLWIGEVTINGVSESQNGGTIVFPTSTEPSGTRETVATVSRFTS